MHTAVDEVTSGIYRLSTYIEEADFTFNQYLINADQPLLFHCGMRGLFPLISTGVKEVMPLDRLRWVSFGHWEADESGAMNDWLEAAPQAQVAVGTIGCMLSVNDLAVRAPRPLEDNEVIDLGGKRAQYLATPHVPHGWDAGVLYEETTQTLFCGDLLTRIGSSPAISEDDPIPPALAAEDVFGATALTPNTAPTIRRLAALKPAVLALMHGPAFHGNGEQVLLDLADQYEARLKKGTEAMRKNLQAEDLGDFLEQAKCATLATHFRDGTTLLSPVWHEWRDSGFSIGVAANDIKVRHIQRNAQVSISVAEDIPPYRGIEVRGKATIGKEGAKEITRRIAIRYLGPEQGNVYADVVTQADLALIRIEPGVLRAWDFADETELNG